MSTPPAAAGGAPRRAWWPWLKRGLTLAFFVAVGSLLYVNARQIEWSEVATAMRSLPASTLLLAALLAVLSYGIFCSYDLVGRHYTGHRLATRSVVLVNFISYAFNLNMGAAVGGVAFRYRLYSRLGLEPGTTTRVITLSMLTNWLGYAWLAGALLVLVPPELPEGWEAGVVALRGLGASMLAVGVAYVALCAWRPGRTWELRGHALTVPGPRLATLQVLLSVANWSVMGTMIWVLLQGQLPWHTVLTVLLAAAVAGVVTHVPAGLGVLEAVFIAFLGSELPQGQLLGALLAYRALYYILPLMLATGAYLLTEARVRHLRKNAAGAPDGKKPRASTRLSTVERGN